MKKFKTTNEEIENKRNRKVEKLQKKIKLHKWRSWKLRMKKFIYCKHKNEKSEKIAIEEVKKTQMKWSKKHKWNGRKIILRFFCLSSCQ